MNIYKNWGFRENPFQTQALGPDEQGKRMLIGRQAEASLLVKQLTNAPKLVTLEGANGVGKTSLVNVTVYELYDAYMRQVYTELYVPCRKAFQINDSIESLNADNFATMVLMEVAQTLIERAEEIAKHKTPIPDTKQISSWLNSPQLKNWQGNFYIAGIGKNSEQNTGQGFEQSGFRKSVEQWLEQLFPSDQGGGVVCILDNLELLQTTAAARQLLERLRDQLFNLRGLRWVLCGATGIIHTVVSSPRLEGVLHNPIEIKGVELKLAKDVLDSRIKALAIREEDAYLPITPDDFEELYKILNRNLRNSLSRADNFCMFAAEQKPLPKTNEEKHKLFETWLEKESSAVLDAIDNQVGARAWEIFHTGLDVGGVFSPGDFAKFGCASPQALRPFVKELEGVQLMISYKEETDQRRKTIQITPKGYFIAYARAKRLGRQFVLPV